MFRLLLLASFGWITVAGSTCPEGFKLFERKPTARNNHTKQWCLGVFEHSEDLGHRELARKLCISLNSSLSLPENQKEVDFALQSYNKTGEAGIAMDGEMSKRCRIQYHRTGKNFFGTTGYCNIHNYLFEYDDANSDPLFIQQHFSTSIPSQTHSYYESRFPGETGDFSSCVILKNNDDGKGFEYGDTSYCVGKKEHVTDDKIHKVVCGRRPL